MLKAHNACALVVLGVILGLTCPIFRPSTTEPQSRQSGWAGIRDKSLWADAVRPLQKAPVARPVCGATYF